MGDGLGLYQEMKSRGLVAQVTDAAVIELLEGPPISAYIGFDPTADSLHVGHLVQIFNLRRLQLHSHRPIAVAGGATGLIGDPSGKSEERNFLDSQALSYNLEMITRQLSLFLDFDSGESSALVLNNADWLNEINLVSFLRDVGKHFSVNQMVSRDSIRTRLDGREQGISYTEFSYMLLQAYDYLHLFDTLGVQLQMGASDQWGNITSGIDLIRRLRQRVAYGLTTPLVLKADGTKFGKSESGTVWLDPQKTSPFDFYQYFLRVEDEVVGGYLRSFTWLEADRLAELDQVTHQKPHERQAQNALASEVTALVHGAEVMIAVKAASEALYSEEIVTLPAKVLDLAIVDAPSISVAAEALSTGIPLVELMVESGLSPSKSDARKLIGQGGVYINNKRVTGQDSVITSGYLLASRIMLLRRGKRDYVVVRALG